jgi:hypothetical protein
MDFSKFDKAINIDELKKDIQEAESNSGNGDYKEVPVGEYEVRITKLELAESKKHDPMVVCWFKILNGEFKNSLIFMNQVITRGFQIHIANDFLRSLDSGLEIEFESYEQYSNLLMDVIEAIDGKFEYALEYGENKGFNTFKITEIFEVE